MEPGNPNICLLRGVESVGRGDSNFRLGCWTVKLSGTSHDVDGPLKCSKHQNIQTPCKYYQINYRDRMVGRISFLNKYFHDISDDVLIWWLRLSETLHEIKKSNYQSINSFCWICVCHLNKKHVMRCAIEMGGADAGRFPCLKKGGTPLRFARRRSSRDLESGDPKQGARWRSLMLRWSALTPRNA